MLHPTELLNPLALLALAAAIAGATWDVRHRRIPNWLTVGMLVSAMVLRAAGAAPVLSGLIGFGLAFAVALPLYMVRAIGAGDVKYLAAFGAVLGAGHLGPALLLVTIAGGLLALLSAAAQGKLAELFGGSARLALYAASRGTLGGRRILEKTPTGSGPAPIPLGVAIAVGCSVVWVL